MSLDAQTAGLLEHMAQSGAAGLCTLSIEAARGALREMSLTTAGPRIEVARCEERRIDGYDAPLRARLYWPERMPVDDTLSPIVVFCHGGGFALGDLDTHDNICRYLCVNAGAIVVNVAYRRAPEHKYPVPPEDCYAALCWSADNARELGGDAARIAVAGDSAGGNLAAAATLMAHERNGPAIAFQVLLYPCVDTSPATCTPSRDAFGGGNYFLSQADFEWIAGMYFTDLSQSADAWASPLRAPDLAGLPPALIIAAGHDMLRDENHQYAERLIDAGVNVEYRCFDGTIHGFVSFSTLLDAGQDALSLVADRLRHRL